MRVPEPLQADLGWALRAISMDFERRASEVVAGIPARARGYLVLLAVSEGLAGSQLQLARILSLDKTRMTYLLDDLQQAGLVERTPDPADRRARVVTLTPHGRATVAQTRAALADVEDIVLAPLSPGDRARFRATVSGLAAATGRDDLTGCAEPEPLSACPAPQEPGRL